LGLIYFQQKSYPQAIAQLERALGLEPSNAAYLYQLGSAFERSRQIDKAETIFRRLLTVDPKHADAYNYLGYMFADEGIKLDESVALVKKALELQPDNGAFVDSLGWAYYKKGMVDEALVELKRAAELSTKEDPTIFEHLGDVYFRKRMVPEAIREWERSLAIDSANEAVQHKLRKARDVLSREGG
jgi:tetratricopeptide (TPR) repeat protein